MQPRFESASLNLRSHQRPIASGFDFSMTDGNLGNKKLEGLIEFRPGNPVDLDRTIELLKAGDDHSK